MKKLVSLVLALLMAGALAACGNPGGVPSDTPSAQPSEEPSAGTSAPVLKESADPEQGGGVLVAYFSATGNTAGVAELVAGHLNADAYEIVPAEPYSAADLDYNNPSSRSSVEMDDESARPAISGSVEGMEGYDVIFLGYPIWWGEAPRIISTFLESCDFGGKTIVPFCTSASSGVGSSAENLHSLAPAANWLDGQRFSENPSESDVTSWVDGLGIGG